MFTGTLIMKMHMFMRILVLKMPRAQMHSSCTTGLLGGWTGKLVASLHASYTRHLWAIMSKTEPLLKVLFEQSRFDLEANRQQIHSTKQLDTRGNR